MGDGYQAVYDATRSRLGNCDVGAAVESAVSTQFGGASYLWQHAQQQIYAVSNEMTRPSVLFRPVLFPDGDAWCALYGEDIQRGLAAWGDTPDAAMRSFDAAWVKERPPTAHTAAITEDAPHG